MPTTAQPYKEEYLQPKQKKHMLTEKERQAGTPGGFEDDLIFNKSISFGPYLTTPQNTSQFVKQKPTIPVPNQPTCYLWCICKYTRNLS